MRSLLLALPIVLAAACGGSAALATASPNGTTTPAATAATSPAATATASPAPSGATVPASTPGGTPIPLPTATQIAAAGNGVVWVTVGGGRPHLFVSLDRGTTWSERAVPAVSDGSGTIAFVNDKEGWLMNTAQPVAECATQDVTLYHTVDGATTWEKLSATGIAPAQCKSTLAFVDATRGYITTYDPNGPAHVYRTNDGGKTWTASQPLPGPQGSASNGIRPGTVSDFTSVLLVGATAPLVTGVPAYVYRSSDGGATWSVATRAPLDGFLPVVITPARWLQVFLATQSDETTDGGASWHAFTTDYGQAAPVSPQIVFGDANTGYAAVRGSIQRTTDGGAHWTAIKTPGTLSP